MMIPESHAFFRKLRIVPFVVLYCHILPTFGFQSPYIRRVDIIKSINRKKCPIKIIIAKNDIISDNMTESSGREGLPQQEKQDIKKWDSAYKRVALNTLRKVLPGRIRLVHPESTEESIEDQVLKKGEKLKVWLDAIDRETVNGFGTFESQEHPGVIFPYTRVSVENVASAAQNRPVNPETEKLPRKTIVVFTPFSPPPGGGPDDIMNTTYDSVLRALPQTAERGSLNAKNITVIALGLPTSKWGSVSEDWLNNLKKNGFSEYGILYAEMLRPILGKGNVEFFAGSMGTILASETARELQEFWEQLRLLLNNPTGVHSPSDKTIKLPKVGRIPLSAKGIQTIVGFVAEALARM